MRCGLPGVDPVPQLVESVLQLPVRRDVGVAKASDLHPSLALPAVYVALEVIHEKAVFESGTENPSQVVHFSAPIDHFKLRKPVWLCAFRIE